MARVYPRVICVWAVACVSAALAAQSDPTPEQLREGERLFRDVYGKEYDRVTKGKATPADKCALGKRLWEASRGLKDNPGLERVLADKALPLVLSDPSGFPIALEIRTGRVTDGKGRADQLAAVASVLEKMARVDQSEKRAALAAQAVELYAEAAELEAYAGQAADAAGYAGKAKMVAQMFLPPPQAAAAVKDIAAAQTESETLRRYAAELAKLRESLKAKPDDAKLNQMLALALLRGGREGEAGKHLAAAPPGKLPALAEALARAPADEAKVGNAYRELAEEHPAERSALLGLARRHYEAALATDPKHPDAVRLRLLVKELPAFRVPGARASADAVAVVDENPVVVEAFSRGTGGTAKVEWVAREGVAGGGCLKITADKFGTLDSRGFADEGLLKVGIDGAAEYRFAGFAYRQVGGTRAAFQFQSAAGPVGARLVAGPAEDKSHPIADRPADEWTVVTRDLFADNQNTPAPVNGLVVWTDGELYLDAVYLTRNHHHRDLRRMYTAFGVGPGRLKP